MTFKFPRCKKCGTIIRMKDMKDFKNGLQLTCPKCSSVYVRAKDGQYYRLKLIPIKPLKTVIEEKEGD